MSPIDLALALNLGTLGYVHFGYPALVGVLALRRGRPVADLEDRDLPHVAIVVAAYNEEAVIVDKLVNCMALDYPPDRMHVVVVTDGSTDATAARARSVPGVEVLHRTERRGKLAAVARAIACVTAPIVVATDANTFLNPEALRRIARHFADARVGAVTGEKRVVARADGGGVVGEGAYWRYESFVKRSESACGSVIGAAGELYACRTELWSTPPLDTVLDDFVASMHVVAAGFRNVYEPGAVATEVASPTPADEIERRTRIAAGGWQAMTRHPEWLHPRLGFAAFAYLSHRVLRWALAPPLLFLLPLLAAVGVGTGSAFALLVAAGCVALGALVALAPHLSAGGRLARLATIAHHAVLAHGAALFGAWRWAVVGQPVTWARVAR